MSDVEEFFKAVDADDVEAATTLLAADQALATAHNENGEFAITRSVYRGASGVRDLLLASGLETDPFESAMTGRTERVATLLNAL